MATRERKINVRSGTHLFLSPPEWNKRRRSQRQGFSGPASAFVSFTSHTFRGIPSMPYLAALVSDLVRAPRARRGAFTFPVSYLPRLYLGGGQGLRTQSIHTS